MTAVVVDALCFAYAAAKKTDVVTELSYSLSFGLVAAAIIPLPVVASASSPAAAGEDWDLGNGRNNAVDSWLWH